MALRLRARLQSAALVLACLSGAALAQPPQQQPAQAQPAEAPKFDILEFDVAGNTVLPDAQIEAVVMPFMGPEHTIADVEAARAALEKRYQQAGYLTVFVDIPEQRVDEGVVHLQVTEGRVERLSVSGARYYSQGRIRAAATEVAEGQVPNFNVVQQQLATLNRGDTRRVQPVLKPGVEPGTVDVDLKVDDKLPLGGSIEFNNNHPAGVDATHVVANLHYDNLFQREHSLSLTLMDTPGHPAQSRVLIAGYNVPLASGDSISATLIGSDSNVATLGGTQALGNGTTFSLRYTHPLAATAEVWQAFSFGADYKDLQEQTVFGSSNISTPLRYVPLQVAYNGGYGADPWISQWGLTLTYGFAPLFQRDVPTCPSANGGSLSQDQFACKRAGADGSFTAAKLDLRQTLVSSLGQFSLRMSGQLANEPLENSEQFVLGGADTVRGYYESAALGDSGLLGGFEWRYDLAPAMRRQAGDAASRNLREFTVLAFTEGGRVYTQNALPGSPIHETLASAGVGLRLQTTSGLSISLDYAHAMKPLSGQATPSALVHLKLGQKL